MPAVSFFAGLMSTALVLAILAMCISIVIAFYLPTRSANVARIFTEWATALSGAGFVAIVLTWQKVTFSCPISGYLPPWLLGVAIAVSYLPLCVLLLLRALEPQWTVLLASRTLAMPFWHSVATIFNSAIHELGDAFGLYLARLLSDGAVLALFFTSGYSMTLSAPLLILAMLLFSRHMVRLAESTGVVLYPPLFGPLPELPSRLRTTPRVTIIGSVMLQLALAAIILITGLELYGMLILRSWAVVDIPVNSSGPVTNIAVSAIGSALQSLLPLAILSGALVWIWFAERRRIWHHTLPTALAAISPLALAYPTILMQSRGWVWMLLAALGLVWYIALQDSAARTVYEFTNRHALTPGENLPIAAVRALGLPPSSAPSGCGPGISEALSAAAAWFSAAALLAVLIGRGGAHSASYALVWGVLSGLIQAGALWWRSFCPRPRIYNVPLSATLEAFTHDIA